MTYILISQQDFIVIMACVFLRFMLDICLKLTKTVQTITQGLACGGHTIPKMHYFAVILVFLLCYSSV